MSISEHKHMPEAARRIEVFTGAGRRRTWSSKYADHLPLYRQAQIYARRFVHILMRAERHSDAGESDGGGHIIEALRVGALIIIAERLESEEAWRE
jgi:hypothetical protein